MSQIEKADFTPAAPNFKHLVYMNLQQLTNFPYIEDDFDALTNYGLLCKVVEYLNDVISNNNQQNETITGLYNAFVSLQDYVNDYFDNLDVQDEINNKLDNMVTDGSLQEIMEIFLNNAKSIIVIGDSYSKHQFPDITKFWWEYFEENLGLTLNTNFFVKGVDGAGFYNELFLNALTSVVNNMSPTLRPYVSDILIVGGYNDRGHPDDVIAAMETFNTYAKSVLPNAKISLAFVSKENPYITNSSTVNVVQLPRIKRKYIEGANKCGWRSLTNTEYILHNYDISYWQDDGIHPSQLGQTELGNYMTTAFLTGTCEVSKDYGSQYLSATASGIATALNNANFISGMNNNISYLKKAGFNQYITIDNTTGMNLQGNTSYEIATIKSNYISGYGSGCSTNQMCWFSGKIGDDNTTVRIPVLCTIYLEYGKLYIRPLAYYNNTGVNPMYVTGIFFNNFKIEDLTEMC